jgi:molecular chaperone HscB
MICWSCEKSVPAPVPVTCPACGAVQPRDPAADHFQVLGVAAGFEVDVTELERRYKDLTRVLHPDRHARAEARARRASLERSVQLNEAWRTLRDPVRRAEYLLARAGVEVAPEKGGPPVPQALLMEVMELREGLAEARVSGDGARVERLAADVRRRHAEAMERVRAGFAAAPAPDLAAIAAELVAVRYFDRFLDEVAGHAEETERAIHG